MLVRSWKPVRSSVVCLSVRLSRALWQSHINNALQISWYYTKGQTLSLSDTHSGWWATPSFSEICAQSDSPASKNADFDIFPLITSQPYEIAKNVQLWRIWSRPQAFRRWSAYVTPKSLKGGSKGDFCFFKIKFNFNRIKSATKYWSIRRAVFLL